MRRVEYSETVQQKLVELYFHLRHVLMLSEAAATKRMARIEKFTASFATPADYAPCRFEKCRARGWRCAPFEKDWVFAYESFGGDGVIVMDMANASSLSE